MGESADVIVVGGGISGFSLAHRVAHAGQSALVLEREPRIGGCLHTERHGSGFWLELGAHTLYNSYGGLIEVLEACNLLESILPRARVPFRLLADGHLRSIFKALDLADVLRSAPFALTARREGRTVQSYFSRLVGPRNYARVLAPLLAAVPSQSADAFPATMLFKKRPRDQRVRKSFTLAGGLQTIIDRVAVRPGIATRTGVDVRAVERRGAGFAVVTAEGERLDAAAVALATPPDAAARLLADSLPEVARALTRIRVARVASVGVVVPRERLDLERVAGIVPTADVFFSAVSRDTVPHGSYRGFTFHFRPDLPLDDRLERITTVLGVQRADIEHVAERVTTLPSPVMGHQQIVAAVDGRLGAQRLAVTGAYFAGLAIEDCVQRSFVEAARILGR